MLKTLTLMWCPKCCMVFGFAGAVEDDIYCGSCKSHRPMQTVVATPSVLTSGMLFRVEDHV